MIDELDKLITDMDAAVIVQQTIDAGETKDSLDEIKNVEAVNGLYFVNTTNEQCYVLSKYLAYVIEDGELQVHEYMSDVLQSELYVKLGLKYKTELKANLLGKSQNKPAEQA